MALAEHERARSAHPALTVVVHAWGDAAELDRCLASLADQTLDHSQFEVVATVSTAARQQRAALAAARSSHPDLWLRTVAQPAPGFAARRAAVAAARGRYVTFVDGRDSVQPRYLEALLDGADQGAVTVAPITAPGTALDGASRSTPSRELPGMLSFDGAKLAPTAWVKQAAGDIFDGPRADALFWARLYVHYAFAIRPCSHATDAAYELRRDAGPGGDFATEISERIALLEGLDSLIDEADGLADDSVRAVLDAWIGEETAAIGTYLTGRPADRPRTVEALDRAHIFHLPPDRLNQGTATGLVVSYCFPPYVDTAAIVAAKRVRERAEVVDVVYNEMGRIRDTDITTRRIAGPFLHQEAVIPSPSAFASWASIDGFRELGMAQIHAWEAERGEAYQTLYSRVQFAASHFLAAAYKMRRPEVRWTAEFSDPLSRDVHGRERGAPAQEGPFLEQLRAAFQARGVEPPASGNTFVWCEWVAYVLADELLFTNANQLSYMRMHCPEQVAAMIEAKAVIAPHPTLPPQFYTMVEHDYPIDSDVVNLAYFGNFYPTRGIDDVLIAIAGLPEAVRDRIRLHVFTTKPDPLRDRTIELGIDQLVLVGPYVGFLAFLHLSTRFDCLVVNDAVTDDDAYAGAANPYLPSKWSDYRGSGSKVWGLIEEGSPLSAQPLDHRSPVGNVTAAQQVLTDMVATARGLAVNQPGGPLTAATARASS